MDDIILDNTRKFLHDNVGTYYEVIIKDNNSTFKVVINTKMLQERGLSDNARCYTNNSIPKLYPEETIKYIFTELCKERKMEDMHIFIAIGDFPVIMKDKTMHPMFDRYQRKYENLYPEMKKIFSRSKIPSLHDDLLLPTRDYISLLSSSLYINAIAGKTDEIFSNTNEDWKLKKPMAIFRGSLTGNDQKITNTRMQSRILSLKYPSYLDSKITETFKYYMFEPGIGAIHTKIDDTILYNNELPIDSKKNTLFFEEQIKYKYILHIDGFTAAWRLSKYMLSYSVILKVDSPWVEHFYNDLKPWIHYIPIKSDLSDLIQRIEWCRENDNICETIAKNAFQYVVENITKEKMLDYMENVIKNGKDNFDCYEPKFEEPSFDIKLKDIHISEIKDLDFSDVKYKMEYLVPLNEEEQLSYESLYEEIIADRNPIFNIIKIHALMKEIDNRNALSDSKIEETREYIRNLSIYASNIYKGKIIKALLKPKLKLTLNNCLNNLIDISDTVKIKFTFYPEDGKKIYKLIESFVKNTGNISTIYTINSFVEKEINDFIWNYPIKAININNDYERVENTNLKNLINSIIFKYNFSHITILFEDEFDEKLKKIDNNKYNYYGITTNQFCEIKHNFPS
jgi:hypothetical protein